MAAYGIRPPRMPPLAFRPPASVAPMAYEVTTPVFEGPFDLLLHLILREQVDLYEVSLAAIVDAYLRRAGPAAGRRSTSTSPPSSCSSPPPWSS